MSSAVSHYFYLYFWRDGRDRWSREGTKTLIPEQHQVCGKEKQFCNFSDATTVNRTTCFGVNEIHHSLQ